MSVLEQLLSGKRSLAVVGLGYVGLPLAVAFAEKGISVIGYDANAKKIAQYLRGEDPTNEIGESRLQKAKITYTCCDEALRSASVFIVAVPTPVTKAHKPDLMPLITASETVGRQMGKGSIIIYESTVYPGVTEDVCIPILEQQSGLCCKQDFGVGYSPERVNPGDHEHTLHNICKIVSATDDETLKTIDALYRLVVEAGTCTMSSIKTAEAVKIAENSQRDLNIAFMNELAMAFDCMGIDTQEVMKGMATKWNALHFKPGLVGGHCIGVDPYYFTYQAEQIGFRSELIRVARQVNESVPEFIANTVKRTFVCNESQHGSFGKVLIMGYTFKENCCDTRNSKVKDLIGYLHEYGFETIVSDPLADAKTVAKEDHVTLTPLEQAHNVDCVIVAVAHDEYCRMNIDTLRSFYRDESMVKLLIDVKGIFDRTIAEENGLKYWRL